MISRRTAMGAVAAAGALSSLAPTATASASRRTVFSDSFESGGFESWTRNRIDGNGAMTTVTDPVRHQHRAARFSVTNDGESYRSEVAVEPWGWSDAFRYRFSIMLPEDWTLSSFGTILAQWHGYKLVNGQSTKPPISLLVQRDIWRLKVHHLTSPTTVGETLFNLPAYQPGVWNDFDLRIRWSTDDTDGALTLLRNGERWAHHAGVNNYHQSVDGHVPIKIPYFKVGIYRASWNPAKGHDYETGGPDVVVYHDAVEVDTFPGRVV